MEPPPNPKLAVSRFRLRSARGLESVSSGIGVFGAVGFMRSRNLRTLPADKPSPAPAAPAPATPPAVAPPAPPRSARRKGHIRYIPKLKPALPCTDVLRVTPLLFCPSGCT